MPRPQAIRAGLEVNNEPGGIPEYYLRPQRVSRVCQLLRGKRFATCELWTHPIGGEVRVDVGGDFPRSEAGRQGFALIDLAMKWKALFQGKGWV